MDDGNLISFPPVDENHDQSDWRKGAVPINYQAILELRTLHASIEACLELMQESQNEGLQKASCLLNPAVDRLGMILACETPGGGG